MIRITTPKIIPHIAKNRNHKNLNSDLRNDFSKYFILEHL